MNHSTILCWIAAVVSLIGGCSGSTTPDQADSNSTQNNEVVAAVSSENESFFVVDKYDPERDAVKDLERVTGLAGESNKRILIEIGGKW